MTSSPLQKALFTTTAGSILLAASATVSADFLDDRTATFGLRNHYMNQDTRNQPATTQDEWSQGFILDFQSGYTEGRVGFGFDGYSALGVKLDSGVDRSPNSFPQRSGGKSRRQFSKFGGTLKAKFSETELKVGSIRPKLPVLQSNLEGRLLPQIFTGALVTSKEVNGLTATLGRFNRVNQRNSISHEKLLVNVQGKRLINKTTDEILTGGAQGNFTSSGLDVAHFKYDWNNDLTTSYSFGRLQDLYKQHIFHLVHTLPLGEKHSVKTDFRFAHSSSDGDVLIDNKAFSGMVTYHYGSHKLWLGYQKMTGDTGYAYVQGADPFLINYIANREFGAKDEASWQIRHDFDFAQVGIPGLSMINRYIKGTGADIGSSAGAEGREWERDFDITYRPQAKALKHFSLRWRNSTVRSNVAKDLDDNRVILSYILPI